MPAKKGTNKSPHWMKITKKTKLIRCPKCKQQMFVTGTGWRQIPIGFGFRGTSFVVDAGKYTGYYCECPRHGVVFAWHTKKLVTKKPRGINRKIKQARRR